MELVEVAHSAVQGAHVSKVIRPRHWLATAAVGFLGRLRRGQGLQLGAIPCCTTSIDRRKPMISNESSGPTCHNTYDQLIGWLHILFLKWHIGKHATRHAHRKNQTCTHAICKTQTCPGPAITFAKLKPAPNQQDSNNLGNTSSNICTTWHSII